MEIYLIINYLLTNLIIILYYYYLLLFIVTSITFNIKIKINKYIATKISNRRKRYKLIYINIILTIFTTTF